ncbi:MAG: MFS transporter [Pseudomonadota bacterium]
MQYRLDTKKPQLACLILLISFPSVAAVLISPALPPISDFFNVSNGYTQQLITIFIVGYALGQLIYSPFANRFGRKIAAYLGIMLYILSSLICLMGIYAHQLDIVIIGRFFMALGASVGMIITFTVINDFYHPEQARPIVSFATLAYSFMPAVAVALGGFITSHFSWIDCFYFYLCYGILMLFIVKLLPETLVTKNHNALKLKSLLSDYHKAFSARRLLLFASIYGLMAAFIYIIASAAPFIGIDRIGLTPADYGVLLLIPYGGQFVGALFAGIISKQFSAYQVMFLGYVSITLGCVAMFILFLLHWITIFSLMMPIFFIMLGLPMTYGGSTVMALTGFDDKATGSAILSFTAMFIALVATFAVTVLPNRNPLVMPSLFIVVLLLAIIAFWYAARRYRDQ